MKRMVQVLFIVAMLLSRLPFTNAQDVPPPLAKVAKAIECPQQEGTSVWKRERVTPITGSENVLVEVYVSCGRRVKVSVTYYPSVAEAINAFQNFAPGTPAKKITNLGDEAYAWGYSDTITMRKSNLAVSVSSVSDIDSLLFTLDERESANLMRMEEVALNKTFARMMDNILSNLDRACQSLKRF